MLETDLYRGCIEHIRKEKHRSLCAKGRLKRRLYTACKELIINQESCMLNKEASEKCYIKKLICHRNKRHPRTFYKRNGK